ncbi:helix-turn-helix domain-containing protein [Aneurinibacillus sp. REN35]|uniref:helix-turn-helix domain-containing protein n=1 Tax=Aneurinibacillus sp. REN35 TaxID=3237286 RepID=UPI0035280E5F
MIRIKLSQLLGANKMTQKNLSELTKIRPNTIGALYHEEAKEISFANLNALCRALNCRVEDILEYIPDTETDDNISVFIDSDNDLTESEKQQVADFIKNLRLK